MNLRRLLSSYEAWFILVILAIMGIGVMSICSATFRIQSETATPVYFKQMAWIGIGWGFFFLFAFYDYRKMQRFCYPFYLTCVGMLILVLLVGRSGGGSQRWLDLGFFNIQPSEWIKLALVVVIADYFSKRHRPQGLTVRALVLPVAAMIVPLLLVLKQPDLGTAMVLVFIFGVMVYLAGFQSRRLGFSILLLIMAFPFLWEIFYKSLKDYQRNRITTFFDPGSDPMGSGYHALQSKIAIGSGGLWGKGLWEGTQSQLKFLPEGHTDFIFSVFAEEWGFLGVFVLLSLYLLLIAWSVGTALRAKDPLGAFIAGGVIAMILFGIVVNIAMTVGIAPVVGVPLPLMSYGGNSLVTTMSGLGLLLNIRMRRFMLFY